MSKNQLFEEIAKEVFFIETLEERHRDCLDFHDISVTSIKIALDAAFEAGKLAARGNILYNGVV